MQKNAPRALGNRKRAPMAVAPEPGPFRIPTGFHPPAQGCEERATLGQPDNDTGYPERVAPAPDCGFQIGGLSQWMD